MEIRRFQIVVGTALKKLLAYTNLAAPEYASWAIDIENYRLLLMECGSVMSNGDRKSV